MKNKFSWDLFHKTPIIVILRGYELSEVLKIAKVCQDSAYHTLEVTMNTPGVEEMISELSSRFPYMNIGAGTVCDGQDLQRALNAGAQFIVSPITDKVVIESSVKQGVPIFPGAYSPTEIYNAWTWGAAAVKVFPSGLLGPEYIRQVLAPLDHIKLVPTGGITLKNIETYFSSGVIGVGMGGGIVSRSLVRAGEFEQIRAQLLKFRFKMGWE